MKRPFGVTLVGALLLVQGVLLIALAAAGIFAIVGGGVLGQPLAVDLAKLTVTDWITLALVSALGFFVLLSGIGVLRLLPWAWLAAMALQGWTLALFLFNNFTHGDSAYPAALLSVVIVFYLNSRTVRQTFGSVHRRESAAAEVTPTIPSSGMATEATSASGGYEASRPSP